MNITGYIKLIDRHGNEVNRVPWRGKKDRGKKIKNWEKLTGKGFRKCAIQISYNETRLHLLRVERAGGIHE